MYRGREIFFSAVPVFPAISLYPKGISSFLRTMFNDFEELFPALTSTGITCPSLSIRNSYELISSANPLEKQSADKTEPTAFQEKFYFLLVVAVT